MSDIATLAQKLMAFGSLEQAPIADIFRVLLSADDLYYNDEESFLSDSQYDALRQYVSHIDPSNQYFVGVGSTVRGGKVALPFQMGSLNQIYQGEYTKWVTKCAIETELVVISDKLDGASAMLVYSVDGQLQIAYSRGDGVQGADITRHSTKIHNVPQQISNNTGRTVTIRAENIISPKSFARVNTGKFARGGRIYKNPRNMVSGLMNSSENHPEVYLAIDMITYEIVGSSLAKVDQLEQLERWGFKVVHYSIGLGGYWNDDRLTKLLNERRSDSDYELDGVVIDIDSSDVRAHLATDKLNPEYAVKYKISTADNYAEPEVVGVTWAISKDGYLKPTIQIKPTNLVGVTIQNCTGFNARFIKENKIGPGAVIALVRSGDVIPFCQSVISPSPSGAQMPEEQATWTSSGADLIVADVANNKTVKFEQLNDFFDSLDAPHLREGNLQIMFDMGFETPESIIELTQEDISSLVGSKPTGKKIFEGLREKLTNIPLYVLMGSHSSMGRGVGKRRMKKLYDAFGGDMTKCGDFDAIVNVGGFDKKIATKITNGVDEFNVFFDKISKYVTLTQHELPAVGAMTDHIVVFTGFRSKELELAVERLGGRMGSSVSSKTTLLVIDDTNSTSSKAVKARELGIKMMSVTDFTEML